MTVILTPELMRKLFPQGRSDLLKAFVDRQAVMAEICENARRVAMAFANVYAETSGLSSRTLAENINYTHQGMAKTWGNRFGGDPNRVIQKYGADAGWRVRAFDDIYGSRMGNRPGTHDGSNFIGRGAPQITGRNGYAEMSERVGHDFINNPASIITAELQPDILQAFWNWKNLSPLADRGAVSDVRTKWNGGHNGLDVVQSQYPRMLRLIEIDTPTTAAVNVQSTKIVADQELMAFQQSLIDFGYFEVGEADGKIGGKTTGAIKAFFTDRGINQSSNWPGSRNALMNELNEVHNENWHRPIAPSRAFATEADLAPKIASIAPAQSAGFGSKIIGWVTGVGSTIGGAVQLMPSVSDSVSPYKVMIQEWFPSIPTVVFMAIIAAVAIYTVRKINQSKQTTVDDFQQGKIN